MRDKIRAVLGWVLPFFVPALQFVLMERYLGFPFLYMYPSAFVVSVFVFILVDAMLAALFRSLRMAYLVTGLAAACVGIASQVLYDVRGVPLELADFGSISTAMSVAGNYDLSPSMRSVVLTVLMLALSVFAWIFDDLFEPACSLVRTAGARGRLLAFMCAAACLAASSAWIGYEYRWRASKPADGSNVSGMISLVGSANTRMYVGTIYDWVGKASMNRMSEPDGYDAWTAPVDAFDPEPVPADDMPDVIVIMNEAFADPDDFGGSHATSDYMPFLRSFEGMPNARLGSLDVSVIAGNTANTEFEVLEGASMAYYPPSSVPYSYAFGRDVPSLARYFSDMGYETWAVHPYFGSNWNREHVYQAMGFDRILFTDSPCDGVELRDLSGTYDPETNSEDMMPDEELYSAVSEILGKRELDGKPRFVFVVTIQNHGGYFRSIRGLDFDVRIDAATAAVLARPDDELAMVKYLSLLKKSDDALRGFCNSLDGRDFDSLVAFFGDHQPDATAHWPFEQAGGIDRTDLSDAQLADFYKVPYGLWATYELPGGLELGRKSACYVGLDLFDALGRGEPEHYAFLRGMLSRVPVQTAVRVESDGSQEAAAMLDEYRYRLWYRISDPDGWQPGSDGGGIE